MAIAIIFAAQGFPPLVRGTAAVSAVCFWRARFVQPHLTSLAPLAPFELVLAEDNNATKIK